MDTLLQIGLANAAFATVLAVLVAAIGSLCRRPALTHALWLVVLVRLVMPPLAVLPLPRLGTLIPGPERVDPLESWTEPVRMPESEPAALPPPVAENLQREQPAHEPMVSAVPSPAPTLRTTTVPTDQPGGVPEARAERLALPSWPILVAVVWLGGTAVWFTLAGVRLYRFGRLLRLVREASPDLRERWRHLAACLGLGRCPAVGFLPLAVSPMLFALGARARLLLPAGLWDRLSDEQQDALVLHELAHFRRRDHWVRLLELLVTGLFWWHPVVWWARREIGEAEEQCCDAWVVWALPSAAHPYALALLETVDFLSQARLPVPPAVTGAGRVLLLRRRLTMIMQGTTSRSLPWGGGLGVMAVALVALPWLPTLAQEPPAAAPPGQVPTPPAVPAPAATPAQPGQPAAPPRLHRPAGADSEPAREEVELCQVQLDGKRAELLENEALVQQAQAELQRAVGLQAKGLADQSAVDQAHTRLQVEKARLMVRQAGVREAELRLRLARRHAGNAARAGDTSTPPSPPGTPTAALPAAEAPLPPLPGSPPSPPPPAAAYPAPPGFPGGPPAPLPGAPHGAASYEARLKALEKRVQALTKEVERLKHTHAPAGARGGLAPLPAQP
jgi:beta-lactamase regulating signal transducer with metallopeptidase domain